HTRCLSDWSSDVCSSDLTRVPCGSRISTQTPLPSPENVPLLSVTLTFWPELPLNSSSPLFEPESMLTVPLAPAGIRPPCTRLPRDRKSTRLNSSHLGISY